MVYVLVRAPNTRGSVCRSNRPSGLASIADSKSTVGGIIFQQMGQCSDVRQVVDGSHLDLRVLQSSPKYISPDSSESIDSNSYHGERLLQGDRFIRLQYSQSNIAMDGGMQTIHDIGRLAV